MAEEHRFIDSLGNRFDWRDAMQASWKNYFRIVPDYTITVDETLVDGPVVVMLDRASGKLRVREERFAVPGH